MINVLHGFAGRVTDFKFLKSPYNAIDLYQLDEFSIDGVVKKISLSNENILIGYSMGARLAAQVFLTNPKAFKRCVLIAGHMGLTTEQKRIDRITVEENIKQKINTLDEISFAKYWNGLDLFKYDKPETINFDRKVLSMFMESFCLSKQDYLVDKLFSYKDKIKFYFGERDSKYSAYARDELYEFDVEFIKDAGHRVYQSSSFQEKLNQDIL